MAAIMKALMQKETPFVLKGRNRPRVVTFLKIIWGDDFS